jgi:hypothetical protein
VEGENRGWTEIYSRKCVWFARREMGICKETDSIQVQQHKKLWVLKLSEAKWSDCYTMCWRFDWTGIASSSIPSVPFDHGPILLENKQILVVRGSRRKRSTAGIIAAALEIHRRTRRRYQFQVRKSRQGLARLRTLPNVVYATCDPSINPTRPTIPR